LVILLTCSMDKILLSQNQGSPSNQFLFWIPDSSPKSYAPYLSDGTTYWSTESWHHMDTGFFSVPLPALGLGFLHNRWAPSRDGDDTPFLSCFYLRCGESPKSKQTHPGNNSWLLRPN
jgi:hypothetical protein